MNLPVQAYLVVAEPRGAAPLAVKSPVDENDAGAKPSRTTQLTPIERRAARPTATVKVEDVSAAIAAPRAPIVPSAVGRHSASDSPAGAASADRPAALPAASSASLLELNILEWLQRHRRYPRSALRSRLQGDVGVRFVIDRQGRLLSAEVISSSGHKLLDQAALELLQRAQPYPLPPLDPGVDRLELSLPVAYRLAPGSS